MAIFRKIHVSFWSDSFISELDENQKLFYIYLLTNERTTQSGIYEITKRQISFDLGYSIDTVSILLNHFEKMDKIKYNSETYEIAIKNWNKFNYNPSGKVQILVNKELAKIKDKNLIQYIYSIDKVSIPKPQEEEEEEQEEEQEQEEKNIPEFLEFLNHAKEKKPLIDEFSVKAKYDGWIENNWRDGNNKKILNWKSKLNNTLPFLKEINNYHKSQELSIPDPNKRNKF